MFSLKEYREPKHRLPDFLTWAILLTPTTVLQKDGMLMRCWRYRGPDLAVASKAEQAGIAERINAALMRLDSGWAIWSEMARHRDDEYQASAFPNVACRVVDLEARSVFKQLNVVHESHYYLTLGWLPPPDHAAAVGDMLFTPDCKAAGVRALDFEYFERMCNEVADVLSGVLLEITPLTSDELLSYLKSCVSTQRQHVLTPETAAYLDAYLPDEAFTRGEISLLGDQCLAIFTIRGFPKRTPLAMLDELCHLGIEFRWMTRFLLLGRDEAQRVIQRHQQRWFVSRKSIARHGSELLSGSESQLQNPIAEDKANEATRALRMLGSSEAAFGYFTSTVVAWDPDPDVARKKALELKKTVQRCGLIAIDETTNGLHAWLGTIPGHTSANVRRPLLHTKNLVRLMPLMSMYAGSRENAHLKAITGVGTPHLSCLSGTSRFDLNLNVDDVGHTLIAGPTSAGKTTLVGLLALMWLKYPRAKVIIYDVGGGARAATLAAGGAYYEPGRPDRGCAFQPLRNIHLLDERMWAAQFIRKIFEVRKVPYDHKVELEVSQALEAMSSNPDLRSRTMTEFVSLLGSWNRDIAAALRAYTVSGPYGHIFDSDCDPFGDEATWRTYEMKPLMNKNTYGPDALVPALMYLGHRDEAMLDGSPVLKIRDECWRFWDDSMMLADTRSDVKTGRVNRVYNVFLTQELEDVAASPQLLSALSTNIKTHIYLPNPKATDPDQAKRYAAFGLTPTEISQLATKQPQKDYFFRNPKGRRWFSLPIGQAALTFVGGASQDDHRAMDAIVQERAPRDYALALLERRGVSWAVDAIKQWQKERSDAAA